MPQSQQTTQQWAQPNGESGGGSWYAGGYNPNGSTMGTGSDSNQGNDLLGSIFGQANAPPDVYFGGGPQGAAGATAYYQQQGRMVGTANAPTIGSQGTDAYNQQMGQAGAGYQNAAAQGSLAQGMQGIAGEQLFNAAAGNGPSAAQNQLQAGTDAAIRSNMAMANSARGQAGLANAQKDALTQNGMQTQQAANQSAQLRAQEMQSAQSQYANYANQQQNQFAQQQLGFAGLGMQGAQGLQGNALAQAQLRAGQNQLNQTGQLGYEQLGFNAQAEQLQAAMANQQQAYGLNESNAKNASSIGGGLISAAGGAMMMSDARVKKNISHAGPEIDDALGKMGGGYNFEYGDMKFGAPGEHTGVMAQDLASSEAGRRMVVKDPQSQALAVKIPEAASFLLGATARLHDRISSLEGGSGKRVGQSKLEEPGGGSKWTLREEPDFILAKNDRTGALEKVATQPLSAGERRQAMAPHGAGPISKHGDMGLGGGSSGPTPPPQTMNPAAVTSPQMMGGVQPMAAYNPNQATFGASQPQGQGQDIGQAMAGLQKSYASKLDQAASSGSYMAGGI